MRQFPRSLILAALLGAACSDHPPSGPDPQFPSGGDQPVVVTPAQARQERLARSVALVLNQPQVRRALQDALDGSPHPERKVHFQWLLGAQAGWLRSVLLRDGGATTDQLDQDALAGPLEVYFPVPAHRAAWRGDGDLLVATALTDHDAPVAFDRNGRRLVLDPDRPPATPVLALVPAEHRFAGPYPVTGLEDDGDGGGGSGGTPTSVTAGLYMTYAAFTQKFESWLKGAPEFETHILAPGSDQALTSVQCAGEHAGGPYAYDQNDLTWTGSVLLYSKTQFDAFNAQHPGKALRILVIEDDDGACVIKTNRDRLAEAFKAVDDAYRQWTAGINGTSALGTYYTRALAIYRAAVGIGSLITSNDDLVGTAVEDVVVGQTWPGANWIVKGENNVTNGGIRLIMR